MEAQQDWWHSYGGEVPVWYSLGLAPGSRDEVSWVQATVGPVPQSPDSQRADGQTVRGSQQPIPGTEFLLDWLGAWDHEPSEEELLAVIPERWREQPVTIDQTLDADGNYVRSNNRPEGGPFEVLEPMSMEEMDAFLDRLLDRVPEEGSSNGA